MSNPQSNYCYGSFFLEVTAHITFLQGKNRNTCGVYDDGILLGYG